MIEPQPELYNRHGGACSGHNASCPDRSTPTPLTDSQRRLNAIPARNLPLSSDFLDLAKMQTLCPNRCRSGPFIQPSEWVACYRPPFRLAPGPRSA